MNRYSRYFIRENVNGKKINDQEDTGIRITQNNCLLNERSNPKKQSIQNRPKKTTKYSPLSSRRNRGAKRNRKQRSRHQNTKCKGNKK